MAKKDLNEILFQAMWTAMRGLPTAKKNEIWEVVEKAIPAFLQEERKRAIAVLDTADLSFPFEENGVSRFGHRLLKTIREELLSPTFKR